VSSLFFLESILTVLILPAVASCDPSTLTIVAITCVTVTTTVTFWRRKRDGKFNTPHPRVSHQWVITFPTHIEPACDTRCLPMFVGCGRAPARVSIVTMVVTLLGVASDRWTVPEGQGTRARQQEKAPRVAPSEAQDHQGKGSNPSDPVANVTLNEGLGQSPNHTLAVWIVGKGKGGGLRPRPDLSPQRRPVTLLDASPHREHEPCPPRITVQVAHCLVERREAKDSLTNAVAVPAAANVIEHVGYVIL
jgi:hypothetical protein